LGIEVDIDFVLVHRNFIGPEMLHEPLALPKPLVFRPFRLKAGHGCFRAAAPGTDFSQRHAHRRDIDFSVLCSTN